jgi:hypothetical protein
MDPISDPVAWKQAVEGALEKLLEARAREKALKLDLAAFERDHSAPAQSGQYGSLDEYLAYCQAWASHKRAHAKIERALKDAQAEMTTWESELKKYLPAEVWFRIGDLAVGVAYSNWGGNNYSLEVRPWADKLPSLNHRYSGD